MPRPNKLWFRKSNRRWYVWHDGKQVNLGPDKQAAQQRFHALMAEPRSRPSVPVTPDISLVEVADRFLDWVRRNRAPDTYEWYRHRLERFCRKFPEITARALRPYHVDEWLLGYELSQTSRRNYVRSVKRCFKWAKSQGYLDANPVAQLEAPSATARETVVSPEEFERLLSFTRNDDFRDLLITTWETGCRPQELLRVEARHVDLERSRWVFRQSESKTKRASRVVYLTEAVMEVTRSRLDRYSEGRLYRNSNGNPWTKDAVGCAFGAIQLRMGAAAMASAEVTVNESEIDHCIQQLNPSRHSQGRKVAKSPAELRCEAKRKLVHRHASRLAPKYSLYMLRHSFATRALQMGVDSLTVAVLLGHKDPSTLARVYQHLNQNPQHLLSELKKAAYATK